MKSTKKRKPRKPQIEYPEMEAKDSFRSVESMRAELEENLGTTELDTIAQEAVTYYLFQNPRS